jgi:predicted GIY-YIG superfamily endonuclease
VPGFLYILISEKSGRRYIGSAVDTARRLYEHNSNAVAATRSKGPWKMAACVAFRDAATARSAECFLKQMKSRKVVDAVIAGTFVWPERFLRPA